MLTRIIEYGSEFDWNANEPFISNSRQGILGSKAFYRSGRDALKAIARDNAEDHSEVLVPTLSCKSMVAPFVINNYRANFYRMNPDLSADFNDFSKKINDKVVAIYSNYFGIQSLKDDNLESIKQRFPKCIMVEDRTHDILCQKRENQYAPDYSVASIRKWLAVPDGGLMWTDRSIRLENQESRFAEIRTKALKLKSLYLDCGDYQIKSEYRKLQSESAHIIDGDNQVCGMSTASEDLLKVIDFKAIMSIRRQNVQTLGTYLASLRTEGMLEFITDKPEKSTLYYPIMLPNKKTRDLVQQLAAKHNIYCPVIWPVPEEAKNVCRIAEHVADCMLGIPCDQRYGIQDMKIVARTMTKFIRQSMDIIPKSRMIRDD